MPLWPLACAQGDRLKAQPQPLLLSREAKVKHLFQSPQAFRPSPPPPPAHSRCFRPNGHLLGYERGRGTVGYQRLKRRLPTSTAIVAPAGERAEA